MVAILKAYWELFFPTTSTQDAELSQEQVDKIIKEKARGNPSLQIGKYVTYSRRKAAKERILKHSFIK
ncbi:MAG: hypothetical protein RL748_926 [Pseudomonadota bacterium]